MIQNKKYFINKNIYEIQKTATNIFVIYDICTSLGNNKRNQRKKEIK